MMDNNEKLGLWQFETIYKYNDHTELIMNQISRQLMIKKTMSDSEYKVHKALCGISHKNIIRILDAVSDSGVCIVIEQFVSGVTLKTFCEREGFGNGENALLVLETDGRRTFVA